MNISQILALVLQAFLTRSAAFAITIGSKHLAVTINENTVAGNSGSFANIFGIVATVLAGQPGTFTIGVFSLTISLLETVPTPSSAAIAAGTKPA